ncbi:integral membrane protein [Cercophora scortea]|uniref:Integral membrane protein n=1 Tax=Cercophora scortea TaxID=314031 RepID=A0AAE0M509_9PEZI|nr:integral membrane protein [Cercophora scortea]
MADTEAATVMPPDLNRGPEILAICGVLVAFAVITLVLRVYVRAKIIGKLGYDDWTMIFATLVVFVEMMIIIPEVGYGAGRHVEYIDPPSNITKGLHLNFATQPLCLIGLCFTKVSVGLFLLRLTTSKRFRYFIIGSIIFTVLSATGNLLTVFFQCRPLAFAWDGTVEGGQCIAAGDLKFAAFFNSSVSVLTDVVFALLPLPMLWKVQLNWRVKTALAGILSLGIFATVAAIVKITFLSNYGKHGDFLFDSSDLTIWFAAPNITPTTVEICTAIIAANFPCLKPLFKTLFNDASTAGCGHHYGSKYKGYVRNTDPSRNTTKSVVGGGGIDGNPGFEMYNRTEVTAEGKVGMSSTSGSEESILPQNLKGREGITRTTDVFVSSVREGVAQEHV